MGGSLLIEEGTTNLLTANQSSFEAGTNAFDWAADGGTAATLTQQDTTHAFTGSNAVKMVWPAVGGIRNRVQLAQHTALGATVYSYQCRAWASAADAAQVKVRADGVLGLGAGYVALSTLPQDANGWYLFTTSGTPGAGGEGIFLDPDDTATVRTVWVDAYQIEQKSYPTSWQIGGTARNAETLTIPTANVLSAGAGTIEHWVSPQRTAGTNLEYLFDGGGGANANLEVWIATDGKLNLKYGTGSSTVTLTSAAVLSPNTLTHIAWRWSSVGVALFISGLSVGSSATAPGIVFGANAFLGSNQSSALQGDSLLDDWRASSIARTDAQILATATSSSPAPEDSATTYKLEFDSDLGVDLTDAPSMYRTGTETVGNDAASTTLMGMAMPLKVQGDMPAPLEAVFTATSATIAKLRLAMRGRRRTGDRVLVNLINYGKTVQLETGSLLTDTTASSDGNATGSGNNAPSTSFGTDNTLTATRLTMDILDYLHLSGYTDGTWDIYAKVGNGAGTGTYSLYATWRFTASGTPVTEPTTAFAISLASTPTWVWIKVATVRVRADESLPRLKFDFHARRDSGADPLKWDELMFIPIGNDARYSVGGALAATDTLHADAGKGLVRQFNANGQLLVSGTREGFLPEGQAGLNAVIFDTVTSQLHTDVSHAGKLGFRYSPRWAI